MSHLIHYVKCHRVGDGRTDGIELDRCVPILTPVMLICCKHSNP